MFTFLYLCALCHEVVTAWAQECNDTLDGFHVDRAVGLYSACSCDFPRCLL